MASNFDTKTYINLYAWSEGFRQLTAGFISDGFFRPLSTFVDIVKNKTSRTNIKQKAESIIQSYNQDDADMGQLAAAIGEIQQEERRRRDARICLGSHKEIIASALDVSYRRLQHLKKEIEDNPLKGAEQTNFETAITLFANM